MTLDNTTQEKIDDAVSQIKQHIINEIENHVDNELNGSSNNAVQNRVIFEEIDDITDAIKWVIENTEVGGTKLPFHFFKSSISSLYLDKEDYINLNAIVDDAKEDIGWFICPKGIYEYIYGYSHETGKLVRALLIDGKTEYTKDDFEEFEPQE